MEAAIAWLVQTILATLEIDKLGAWIRRVGLADDVQKLKSEIRRIKIVVSAVKERGIGNDLLAESLALIQDHLYEADDVVDELDYYRLQHQVQGVTIDESEIIHGAEPLDEISSGDADTPMNSSVGKLRSMVWEHFKITVKDNGKPVKAKCTYCREEFNCETKTNGTSSMKKHLESEHSVTCTKETPGAPHPTNPSSASEAIETGSSSRRKGKKRRSKAWDLFDIIEEENGEPVKARCKYCPTQIKCGGKYGTGGMLNHNKICKKRPGPTDQLSSPSSTGDASANVTPTVIGDPSKRKRRRDDENSAQTTAANMHTPWDKTIYSNMIQKITSQLQNNRGEVSEVLKLRGSDTASSSNPHQSNDLDQHLRTSSFVPTKVYGRSEEKNSIIKMITEDQSDCVAVLPIVGIAGVGKTVLAQLVYNDLDVKKQFHHRIWVWVSRNFDEVRLTTEMINFVSRDRNEGSTHKNERHEGIRSFVRLQEILKEHLEYQSKKFLLVLDDVWDNFDNYRWEELLAPLMSSDVKGNVILVTTRNLSVAQKIRALKPFKLGALANDDFWLLFESRAFGDKNCERRQSLSIIARKIAEKLKGNPLAAETAGALLREHLSVDHWSNILMNEDWKSLELSRGIMPALKLSYDQLPYHLQQCFSFSSIFPDSYQFLGEELVHVWISLGFVGCSHSRKRLEEIGQFYLTDLVNLGFIQQVGEEESSLGSQSSYSICGLMHDFVRIVSRNYCATIDGLQYTNMLPTIQHLSVVTDSAYSKDRLGHILRNNKFEEKLRNTVVSVRKLRTLVLIGAYDSHFFQVFQDKFRIAHNLRLLQMSAPDADFYSLMCSLVNPTHLRYLKLKSDGLNGALPPVLIKFFHLQVLDVGSNANPILPDGMHNLVVLRHLVAEKGVHSKIASIGSMTSLQELHEFKIRFRSSRFQISQLQSMNELVELRVSQLYNVESREEAYGARFRDKVQLEKLHLSWKDASSDEEFSSDSSSESSEELLPMDDAGPSSEPSTDTSKEVLEGLEPHMDLKHLQISGYNGTSSPTWLASNISVTSLQTLHLDCCGEWRILPSLENLPFLTKLKLRSMWVTEVLVPSLEELVLIEMPELVRCSSTSVEGLNSSLRVLQIEKCHALKEFDLFENDDEFEIEQTSWLPGLRKLVLCHCRNLKVLKPLPPSTTCSELLIGEVSILPCMKGSCSEELLIGYFDDDGYYYKKEYSNELRVLDNKILAFHNLSSIKLMKIDGCQNLSFFSFEGFSQLVSLKSLEIERCGKLFSSDVMADATYEEVTAANWKAFPCLESLSIMSCGITGKWLSQLLRHAPGLQELTILTCPEALSSFMLIKDGNNDQANERRILPISHGISSCSQETLQPCFPDITWNLTSLKKLVVKNDPGLESLQLQSWCPALEELRIQSCGSLTALEGLRSLGSLRHLEVSYCPRLSPLLESFSRQGYELCSRLETLTIDDPSVLTTSLCVGLTSLPRLKLQRLVLTEEQGRALVLLKSLHELEFDSCTGLEVLPAGLHLLPSLKRLKIYSCQSISMLAETGLPHSLEELEINSCSRVVYLPARLHLLPSLKKLKIFFCRCISMLPETGLPHSLEELEINSCSRVVYLPARLHLLPSLKKLKIFFCRCISRLPETGLPPSLEELDISSCSKELTDQCRALASSKLRVKIDGEWLVL